MDHSLYLVPVRADQLRVQPVAEQWRERTVLCLGFERVELAVRQARDAGLERQAEQMHDGEDDVRDAAAVDMEGGNIDATLVTQDSIKGMHGLACGAGDHLLMERGISVGDRGVDLDDRVPPVMGVDGATCLARSAEIECLSICRCAPAFAEPGGDRLRVNGVRQVGKSSAEGFVSHMPHLHAQESTPGSRAADFSHTGQAEIRRFRDQGRHERPYVNWRQARRDMRRLRKARPQIDLIEKIGDADVGHHAVEGADDGGAIVLHTAFLILRKAQPPARKQHRSVTANPSAADSKAVSSVAARAFRYLSASTPGCAGSVLVSALSFASRSPSPLDARR